MAELVEVTDPDDPRLADYRDLRDVQLRKHLEAEHGLFLAEGEKVVRRAVEAGFAPRSFLMAPRWLDGLADVLDRDGRALLRRLARRWPSRSPASTCTAARSPRCAAPLPGLLRARRRPLGAGAGGIVDHTNVGRQELHPLAETSRVRVAVLEDLVDHANVGALFRNAAALGLQGVLLSPRCADPLYRRAVKVSMGAALQLPWTRVHPWPDGLSVLKRAGFVVAAMTLGTDAIALDELAARADTKLALLFGTEGHGLSGRAADFADVRVRIPMNPGVDSLNVAAASAVAFYATQ